MNILRQGCLQSVGFALLLLNLNTAFSQAGQSPSAKPPAIDESVPPANDNYPPTGAMDTDGRAFVATRMGIQVFDRNGRSAAILPMPANAPAISLCFGGHDFDTLYVAAGGKIYRRKLAIHGAPPWAGPIELPHADGG